MKLDHLSKDAQGQRSARKFRRKALDWLTGGIANRSPTWMVAWVAKTLCCLVDICKLVITFVTMVISLVTMAINKASWTFHGVLHAKVRHALR